MGLVESNGILGLDFGLTAWPFIPNYQGDNNSIEKLCSKIIRHGSPASAQACRLGLWKASENSRWHHTNCLRSMIEKSYSKVLTTMSFVRGVTWDQLSIPIPESPQWVKRELEVHQLKRKILKEKNWPFWGVYNSDLQEEFPCDWRGKLTKFLPNWQSMQLPVIRKENFTTPVQEKPWAEPIGMAESDEIIPIKVLI